MKTHMFPIIDGHNDLLLNLYAPEDGTRRDFFTRGSTGHLDLPRAREGGLVGGFFAVYVPPAGERWSEKTLTTGSTAEDVPASLELPYAQQAALAMTAELYRLEMASAGRLKVVRTAGELRTCLDAGVLGAILHFEGAEMIDEELDALEVFYQAGLRSLGLVWSRPNIFGQGVPFRFPHSPDIGDGLTEAGRRLVRRCNQLGIMVDLSHLNEKGFWDVASLSQAPLVATHSNAHALCPASRNLTDRQLDAIRDSDGMVGLNFSVTFLRPDGDRNADTPIDVMVQQIDYLVRRLGIDRVGLGSDFDGATIPQEIGDVAGLPKLVDALAESGFDEQSLRKLTNENWLRVLERTWRS
jgi:membrane dipeptidase